jgi:hypothetical protein
VDWPQYTKTFASSALGVLERRQQTFPASVY